MNHVVEKPQNELALVHRGHGTPRTLRAVALAETHNELAHRSIPLWLALNSWVIALAELV